MRVLRNNLFCYDCLTAGVSLHPSPDTDTGMVCNIYMEKQCKSDAEFATCFFLSSCLQSWLKNCLFTLCAPLLVIGLQLMGRYISYILETPKLSVFCFKVYFC